MGQRSMHRLGVLGWPVAHSRSPDMHNAALRALGMEGWRYQLLPVPAERFADTVRALPGAGFVGANVTIPHKHAALALADETSASAREIGAANTLTFLPGGRIAAENTDAPGFLVALGVPVRGMSAQVLGAGGSARAVAWALREAGAREVSVCNRTAERASALARELGVRAVARPAPADLLVNCTSVGLGGAHPDGGLGDGRESVPPAALRQSASDPKGLNLMEIALDQVGDYAYVVDLAYSASPSALLSAANAHGAHTVDGLEVLLAQGALSFELWTGRKAPLQVMREALRAASAR
jgi:shikimate dehydrogenase